jgi:hypothetical protein
MKLLAALLLLSACGDMPPSLEARCRAKGGVFMRVYKSRDICLKREAVLEYEEYK